MHRVAPCNGEGGKGNGLGFFLIGGVFFLIDHMFNVSFQNRASGRILHLYYRTVKEKRKSYDRWAHNFP